MWSPHDINVVITRLLCDKHGRGRREESFVFLKYIIDYHDHDHDHDYDDTIVWAHA